MKIIKLFLLIVVLTSKLTILNAEVKPTFKQSFSLNGIVNSPADVDFSPDGTKIFFTSFHEDVLYQFTLTTPFDISTLDTSSEVQLDIGTGDDDIGSFSQGHAFNSDGTKIFAVSSPDSKLNAHTLTTPYDLSDFSQDADDGIDWEDDLSAGDGAINAYDIEFNNDGTKMYLLDAGTANSDGGVVEYDLSTPYLTSSATFVNELVVTSQTSRFEEDLEFDDDGTRMYIIESGTTAAATNIYVYKLSTPFHTSTATFVGSIANFFDAAGSNGTPLGLAFSNDGMKLYQTTYTNTGAGALDMVYEYDLSCPYGIVICETDQEAIISSQIDTAKSIISNNTSHIFKRFDWIKRHENNKNLNSNNINLNIHNPVLASLTNSLQASLSNNNNKKEKHSDWSFWTHGDISIGRVGDKASSTPKELEVSGIMLGGDKILKNNKIIGAAIRYGNNKIKVQSTPISKIDTDSLAFNLYGSFVANDKININMVLGVSALSIDQITSGKITGERNGKQIFSALNILSHQAFENSKLTPTLKVEFGITELSEYTDFGTADTAGDDIYDSLTFETGSFSTGVKYNESNDHSNGSLFVIGSLEYVNDFTPNIDYQYKNTTDNISVTKTVSRYSTHNIKGNLGFEILYESGYTFAFNYERFQGLSYSSHQDSILFKFSHIREEDSEFAFNYKPLQNNQMELSYIKDVKGFDIKVSSNYSLMSKIDDYGSNIEVSSTF